MKSTKKKFREFLSEYCRELDVVGEILREVKFLLVDTIPIGQLCEGGTVMYFCNELQKCGKISHDPIDVCILAEIAELNGMQSATDVIERYLTTYIETKRVELTTTRISENRKRLYKAIEEMNNTDLKRIKGEYTLNRHTFDTKWDVIFHLELERKLIPESKKSRNRFANVINSRARRILLGIKLKNARLDEEDEQQNDDSKKDNSEDEDSEEVENNLGDDAVENGLSIDEDDGIKEEFGVGDQSVLNADITTITGPGRNNKKKSWTWKRILLIVAWILIVACFIVFLLYILHYILVKKFESDDTLFLIISIMIALGLPALVYNFEYIKPRIVKFLVFLSSCLMFAFRILPWNRDSVTHIQTQFKEIFE